MPAHSHAYGHVSRYVYTVYRHACGPVCRRVCVNIQVGGPDQLYGRSVRPTLWAQCRANSMGAVSGQLYGRSVRPTPWAQCQANSMAADGCSCFGMYTQVHRRVTRMCVCTHIDMCTHMYINMCAHACLCAMSWFGQRHSVYDLRPCAVDRLGAAPSGWCGEAVDARGSI